MAGRDLAGLRRIAASLLPGEATSAAEVVRGEFHDVVLLPGRAVVKAARGRAAQHLRRRAALTDALARQQLPFAVPAPLTPVIDVDADLDDADDDDGAAVALSWCPGVPAPAGSADPAELRRLLDALAAVDVTHEGPVGPWLDVPHAYAGRDRWPALIAEVVARLPADVREEAGARVEAASALPAVDPVLVHGDLAGDNLRWGADGALASVVDWDLASAWDQGVDAACLSWFGWPAVADAVDPEVLERARTWAATFPLEHPASAIDNGEDDDVVQARLAWAARELREARQT